jgi:hypothetical protein
MNLECLPGLIQHGITTEQAEPRFKWIFRAVLIVGVSVSVLIPVVIAVIRRHKQTR